MSLRIEHQVGGTTQSIAMKMWVMSSSELVVLVHYLRAAKAGSTVVHPNGPLQYVFV